MNFSLLLLVAFALFCIATTVRAANIQPEPVTDPAILKKLNCRMFCRNEVEDESVECVYNCMSQKCYRSVFKRIIDKDTGRLSGTVTEALETKFEKCLHKEMRDRDEL